MITDILLFPTKNDYEEFLWAAGYTFKENVPVPHGEDGPVRSYEIDFLLSRNNKICPVEIKSSGYNSHKSLDRFHVKYSSRTMQRYLVYTKDLKKDKDILCIPAYMSALI